MRGWAPPRCPGDPVASLKFQGLLFMHKGEPEPGLSRGQRGGGCSGHPQPPLAPPAPTPQCPRLQGTPRAGVAPSPQCGAGAGARRCPRHGSPCVIDHPEGKETRSVPGRAALSPPQLIAAVDRGSTGHCHPLPGGQALCSTAGAAWGRLPPGARDPWGRGGPPVPFTAAGQREGAGPGGVA